MTFPAVLLAVNAFEYALIERPRTERWREKRWNKVPETVMNEDILRRDWNVDNVFTLEAS